MTEFIDKRKNFRFPAFDDEEGVKLKNPNRRVLFEGEFDSIFTSARSRSEAEDTESNEPEWVEQQTSVRQEPVPPMRQQKAAPVTIRPTKKEQPAFSQQRPLKEEKFKEVRKPVFYSDHRASLEKKVATEKKDRTLSPQYSQPGKYQGRSHFVPKHIPSSVVPQEKKANYTKEEMLNKMKKNKSSYFIFDEEEPTSFQDITIEKKTITPFETKQLEEEIPFTRREFKQLRKEKGKRKEKEEEIPAISKKKMATQTKSTRLEKSLPDLMKEEAQLRTTKYFY